MTINVLFQQGQALGGSLCRARRGQCGIVTGFLQVFDVADRPYLNFLVICHFISCQVFNFCLLEVTPL